jgi:hypothetical protein
MTWRSASSAAMDSGRINFCISIIERAVWRASSQSLSGAARLMVSMSASAPSPSPIAILALARAVRASA